MKQCQKIAITECLHVRQLFVINLWSLRRRHFHKCEEGRVTCATQSAHAILKCENEKLF